MTKMTSPNDDELIERLSRQRGRLSVFYMQAERDEEPVPGTLACIIDVLQGIERTQGEIIGRQASRLTELKEERERLNQLALDGVNMGIATGIELSAEWLVKNIDRLGQHNVKLVAAAMISEVCEGKQGDE